MPTLRAIRHATADRVAPFLLVVAGAEGPGGIRAGTAIGVDRRRVVSSDLASLDATGLGAEAPPDGLRNDWAYVPSAPAVPGPYRPAQQRRVPVDAYNAAARADEVLEGFDPLVVPPDTPCGVVVVERPFPTVIPAGTEVELHALPALRGGKSAGLHSHINHALRVILRADTILVQGESGKTVIDVTAQFPWMTNAGCFRAARYVETTAGVETYQIPGARLRFDGEKVLLSPQTTVSTGQSIPVEVLRPVGTWIKPAGGTWGESAVGLIDDDDECTGDIDSIAVVAAFHAADAEAQACIVGSPEQATWAARAQTLAQRTPFLRDQRMRTRYTGTPWPDIYSLEGPTAGRAPPYFR